MKYLQRFETFSDYSLAQSSLIEPCVARITETNETKYNKLGRVIVHLTNDSNIYGKQIQIINWEDSFDTSVIYSIELDGNDVTETIINNSGMTEFKDNKFIIFKFRNNNIPNHFFKNLNDFFSFTSLIQTHYINDIGDNAFQSCSSLTSIIIDNSVTSIGNRAFYNCSGLTSIEIPNSVTSIPSHAFYDCSSLESIEIPDSVTLIGSYAFYGCSSLESIEIPNSVTSINHSTFYDCSSLTSIIIGNSVKRIVNRAFYNCSSLESIEIPDSVIDISTDAFYNCSSLTSITCYSLTAPTIDSSTFSNVVSNGTLKVPTGSNYDNWMSALNNWTIQYI